MMRFLSCIDDWIDRLWWPLYIIVMLWLAAHMLLPLFQELFRAMELTHGNSAVF